ncbi:MAG: enoyl-CoA hydratase/isomerase family protein [Planctomycetota bacterium]
MPDPMLPIERDTSRDFEGVVVVTLEQPGKPVVVLDKPLIEALARTLGQVPHDARGLVLRSASERVFVAGADLKTIYEWDDATLHEYLQLGARTFMMLAEFPFPTCAAINGAALGGGLELAMHCDGLVAAPGARPYPVGLPEAGLALCPGWGGTNLLPARVPFSDGVTATAYGKPLVFDAAVEAGLFDAVASDADALLATAMQWTIDQAQRDQAENGPTERGEGPRRRLDHTVSDSAIEELARSLPETEPAQAVMDAVRVGVADGYRAACQCEREHLVRLRHLPEARSAIEAFFAKSAKK